MMKKTGYDKSKYETQGKAKTKPTATKKGKRYGK
jgi:hypothetical protein